MATSLFKHLLEHNVWKNIGKIRMLLPVPNRVPWEFQGRLLLSCVHILNKMASLESNRINSKRVCIWRHFTWKSTAVPPTKWQKRQVAALAWVQRNHKSHLKSWRAVSCSIRDSTWSRSCLFTDCRKPRKKKIQEMAICVNLIFKPIPVRSWLKVL